MIKNNSHTMMILSAALTGKTLEKVLSADEISNVFHLASKHDLGHLVPRACRVCGVAVPEALKQTFFQVEMKAVWRYERLIREQEAICRTLEAAGIPFLPLKGAVIRELYPEPWMRTSCDIDVLVHREDLERAVAALETELQYRSEGQVYHDVSMMAPSGVHVEVHFKLNVHLDMVDQALYAVWDHCTTKPGWQQYRELEPEFFVFYFVAHMAGHLLRGGCGIRPVLDLWLMEQSWTLNQEKLTGYFADSGLLAFYEAVRKLAAVWFSKQEPDPVTEALSDYILTGGVYGTKENSIAVNQSKGKGTLGYWKNRLFFSREHLQGVYPELEKHPERYAYYQVKRWFRFLRKGTRDRIIEEYRQGQNMDKEKLTSTAELLSAMGLGDG